MGMLWTSGFLYINGNGKATDGKAGPRRLPAEGYEGRRALRSDRADPRVGTGTRRRRARLARARARAGRQALRGQRQFHRSAREPFAQVAAPQLCRRPDPRPRGGWQRLRRESQAAGRVHRAHRRSDGANPELFASGERNTYDIAFNPDGEIALLRQRYGVGLGHAVVSARSASIMR